MVFFKRSGRPQHSLIGSPPYFPDSERRYSNLSFIQPPIRGLLGVDATAGLNGRSFASSGRTGNSTSKSNASLALAGSTARATSRARANTLGSQPIRPLAPDPYSRRIRQMDAPSFRRPWTNDVPLGSEELGYLAAWHESGKKGLLSIAYDPQDPGKGGYGPWQLSSAWGMAAFLDSKWGRKYLSDLGGASPGTKLFNDRYKVVAARDPVGFRRAQHDFVYHTMYKPVADHAAANGFDLANQGIREAIFSLTVQHSGAKSIIDKVVAAKGHRGDPTNVISELYKHRMDYVGRLDSLSPNQKKDNIARYKREARQILLHDALVRNQDLLHKDLIDVSNPQNYLPEKLPR